MQDLLWVSLAAGFFLLSGWFADLSARLMPGPESARERSSPPDRATFRPELQP